MYNNDDTKIIDTIFETQKGENTTQKVENIEIYYVCHHN